MNTSSLFLLLAELLGKSALIVVVALLLIRLLPRLSAAQRSLIWTAAFCVVVLLPATKLLAPHWAWRPERQAMAVPASGQIAPATSETGASRPAKAVVKLALLDGPTLGLAIWSLGLVALLAYRGLGLVQLARLMHRSEAESDPRILAWVEAARTEFPAARRVQIRRSPSCSVPLTWGLVRSVIMLPAEAAHWPEARWQAGLRHEFAHIVRRDWLARWIAQLAAMLFWPNPLVWMALRALGTSQEQACDDAVLQAGTRRDDYAADLVTCARLVRSHRLPREALAMARPSTLETRIVSILDEGRSRVQAGRVAKLSVAMLASALLAVSASAQVKVPEADHSKPEAPGHLQSGASHHDIPPVEITADGNTNFEGGLAIATKNVVINYKALKIFCDYAEYSPDSRDLLLSGHVRGQLYDGDTVFAGDRLVYNLETSRLRTVEADYKLPRMAGAPEFPKKL